MSWPSQLVESRLEGCLVHALVANRDERGSLVEIFREHWPNDARPVQWNVMTSEPRVLRGVHVHPTHDDYLVLAAGRATIGLHDLRPDSPSCGCSDMIELSAERPAALSIPHGVAHGFCFTEPSVLVYGVTHYFDPGDELGCRWDDPDLGLVWPMADPIVSPRDATAGSLTDLRAELAARHAF